MYCGAMIIVKVASVGLGIIQAIKFQISGLLRKH